MWFWKNLGKGENAGYLQFLLFPQCFPKPSVSGSSKVGIKSYSEGKEEHAGCQHFLLLPQCFQMPFIILAIKTQNGLAKASNEENSNLPNSSMIVESFTPNLLDATQKYFVKSFASTFLIRRVYQDSPNRNVVVAICLLMSYFSSSFSCSLALIPCWSVGSLNHVSSGSGYPVTCIIYSLPKYLVKGGLLTPYHTTNFRLFQIERLCRQQFKIQENGRKSFKPEENTVGKGEIAHYEQFLLFPQCFQKACFLGASKGVIVWEWVKAL